jgi:hypothetical protein
MTDKEAMQIVLDAIEESNSLLVAMLFEKRSDDEIEDQVVANRKSVETLRAALAQPEPKPVAWMYVNPDDECEQIEYGKPFDDPSVTPLYTAPQREWVGLTDKAKLHFIKYAPKWTAIELIEAIEIELKEKNSG